MLPWLKLLEFIIIAFYKKNCFKRPLIFMLSLKLFYYNKINKSLTYYNVKLVSLRLHFLGHNFIKYIYIRYYLVAIKIAFSCSKLVKNCF